MCLSMRKDETEYQLASSHLALAILRWCEAYTAITGDESVERLKGGVNVVFDQTIINRHQIRTARVVDVAPDDYTAQALVGITPERWTSVAKLLGINDPMAALREVILRGIMSIEADQPKTN